MKQKVEERNSGHELIGQISTNTKIGSKLYCRTPISMIRRLIGTKLVSAKKFKIGLGMCTAQARQHKK